MTGSTFTHDGVTLAYDDLAPEGGAAETVLLVHGFASNRREGWRRTGWYDALQARGARCVALDLRGHGESEKLYDPAAYARERLAADVLALIDHLQLSSVDLVGYSLGARTAFVAAQAAPGRISRLVLGGVGESWLTPEDPEAQASMAEAFLTEDPETIAEPMLRGFRAFVDQQGEDRRAIAACARALVTAPPTPAQLNGLAMPVLVVAGARDRLAGAPEPLAACLADGRAVTVPGCDHFSAIPHALTKAAVFDFFDGVLEADGDPFARSF
jgi:pimeloyl-ACP methyl ester carboxylesterase